MKNIIMKRILLSILFTSLLIGCDEENKENASDVILEKPEHFLITEAKTSPLVLEQIETLKEIGWTVPDLDAAALHQIDTGQQIVLIPAKRVVTDGRTPATIDIVVIKEEDSSTTVLLLPVDENSAQALSSDLETPPEVALISAIASESNIKTTSLASSTCPSYCGTCSSGSCSYIEKVGFNIGCWSITGNPLGYYYTARVWTGRWGTTGCFTWRTDYYDDIQHCPALDEKTYTYKVRGMP